MFLHRWGFNALFKGTAAEPRMLTDSSPATSPHSLTWSELELNCPSFGSQISTHYATGFRGDWSLLIFCWWVGGGYKCIQSFFFCFSLLSYRMSGDRVMIRCIEHELKGERQTFRAGRSGVKMWTRANKEMDRQEGRVKEWRPYRQ